MISKLRLFFLIFVPAAISLLLGMALVQQKNISLSEIQINEQLKSQWNMASIIAQDEGYQEALKSLSQKTQLRLTLVNEAGEVIFDSVAQTPLDIHKDREEIRSALAGVPSLKLRYSHTTKTHTVYYAEKLESGLVLRLAYPSEYYGKLKAVLVNQMLFALLILMAAVALFAFLAARKLNRMLSSLSVAVKKAQDGSFDLPSFNNDDLDQALYALSSATRELKHYSEENLKLSGRLEYILENINEGVLLIEGENILYHNQRAGEILGCIVPEDIKAIRRAELIYVFEGFINGEGGELKLNDKIINVDLAKKGSSRLVVLHDVCDRIKYLGYKSDLIGNISHELKTPLTLIMAAAEVIIKDGEMPKAFLDKFLKTIYKNTQRVNFLLDDLIFLHQLENAQNAELALVNLDETIGDLKELLGEPSKAINFNYEPSEVKIHSTHLISVLTNLINNALKYSSGDHIDVNLKKLGQTLEIKVSDLGPKIALAERERIFERFYSLSISRNREKSGTGLGLSIVKHISKLYNGQALVEENQEGGNTFVVRLVEK